MNNICRQILVLCLALASLPAGAQPAPQSSIPLSGGLRGGAAQPSSPEAVKQFEQGEKAMRANDLAGAAAYFRKVIELSPEYAPAYMNLGSALVAQNKSAEAVDVLTKALAFKPVSAILYLNLGTALHEVGKINEARDMYKKAIAAEPSGPYAKACADGVKQMDEELGLEKRGAFASGGNDYLTDVTEGGAYRWPASAMPIKIYIDSTSSATGFRPALVDVFKQAVQDWCEATQGKIKVAYTDNPDKAQMVCRWSASLPGAAGATEPGHVMRGDGKDGIEHVDMTVLSCDPNSKKGFSDSQARRIDLHELGLAFGFNGQSINPKDVFFGAIPAADAPAAGLSERDKNTMRALYNLSDADVARFLRKTPAAK